MWSLLTLATEELVFIVLGFLVLLLLVLDEFVAPSLISYETLLPLLWLKQRLLVELLLDPRGCVFSWLFFGRL